MTGSSIDVLIIVVLLASAVSLWGAVVALSAAGEARKARKAVERERHDLNRTMTYQHPRSIR